jgi:hypothetical protein
MQRWVSGVWWLVFCLFGGILEGYSQKTERVEACGVCAMNGTETLLEVQQCALNKAMEEALNRAGIPMEISSSTQMQLSESGSIFNESFSKAIQTQYRGGITSFQEIKPMERRLNRFDVIEIERCIRAQVLPYKTGPDPAFKHDVQGLLPAYPHTANLRFTVKSPGSYMLAFWVEGDSATCFYPNPNEQQTFLKSGESHVFPGPRSQIDYEVFNERPRDTKSVMLLFFKKPMPPPPIELRQDLLLWIQGIEPEQRQVLTFPVILDTRR